MFVKLGKYPQRQGLILTQPGNKMNPNRDLVNQRDVQAEQAAQLVEHVPAIPVKAIDQA